MHTLVRVDAEVELCAPVACMQASLVLLSVTTRLSGTHGTAVGMP